MTHSAVCRYAKSLSAVEWLWAEGMDPEEAAYHSIVHGGDFHVQCFGELIAQTDEHPEPTPATKTSFGDLSAIP